jgi:hypothetical protein
MHSWENLFERFMIVVTPFATAKNRPDVPDACGANKQDAVAAVRPAARG